MLKFRSQSVLLVVVLFLYRVVLNLVRVKQIDMPILVCIFALRWSDPPRPAARVLSLVLNLVPYPGTKFSTVYVYVESVYLYVVSVYLFQIPDLPTTWVLQL
eukprot:SAG11_NODE_9735_length_884_cov_1.642038_1_plen_102_part_00